MTRIEEPLPLVSQRSRRQGFSTPFTTPAPVYFFAGNPQPVGVFDKILKTYFMQLVPYSIN